MLFVRLFVCVPLYVCPQVCSVLPNALQDVEAVSPAGAQKAAAACNARHKAWLARSPHGQQRWKPPKVHRRSVVSCLRRVDAQLRTSTAWDGLIHVQFDSDKVDWAPAQWRTWPSFAICGDQAGDNTSMIHAASYKLGLNVLEFWDWSHGCANDMKLGLQGCGLWSLQVLLLVVHNLGHGPERDEMLRFAQINECLAFLFKHFQADTCDLFKARAPAMLKELGDKVDFLEGKSANQSLWEYLKNESAFPKLEHPCRLCQFMGFQQRNVELLETWTVRLFKSELLALECDWLHGSAVNERIPVKTSVLAAADDVVTTSSGVAHPDVKLLRGGQVNAVVISVLTLGEQTHQRLIGGITRLSEPVQLWRGKSAKDTRSCSECSEWLLRQHKGEFYEHMFKIFKVFSSDAFMSAAGFLEFQEVADDDKAAVLEEDARMAHVFGQYGLVLFAQRFRRCMYAFVGWPHRLFRMLLSDNEAKAVVSEFKQDYEVYTRLRAVEDPPAALLAILDRSPFMLPKTKQWVEALQHCEWQATESVLSMASEKCCSMSSSLPIEEFIHYMKNMKRARASKRLRRPQRAMATVIGQEMLRKRFHFQVFDVDTSATSSKKRRTSITDFQAKPGCESIKLDGIATLKQKASYYSPVANDLGRTALDRVVLKEVDSSGDFGALKKLGMSVLCDASRPFVFRTQPAVGKGMEWHIGLFAIGGTGACAQKVDLVHSPSKAKQLVVVPDEKMPPSMLCITDWADFVARPVSWKSWSWQMQEMPESKTHWPPAVRLFVTGEERPLLQLAAEQAWWGLDTQELHTVADGNKIARPADLSEFSLLFEMTKTILKKGDAEVLEILKQRLVEKQPDDEFEDALLELDEAHQVIDQNDVKEITAAQQRTRTSKTAFASFAHDYVQKKKAVRGPAPAKPKAGGKKKKDAAAIPYRPLPENAKIPQSEAKTYLPPGGHIWQCRTSNAWAARVPPLKPVHRSWRKHGHEGAVFACVQEAWKQWCVLEGVDPSDCPVAGVFGAGVAPASSA